MIIKHITNFAIAMALSQTLSAETNYFEAGKETLAEPNLQGWSPKQVSMHQRN